MGNSPDKENFFLNSLNEQEYSEFLRQRNNTGNNDKFLQSGLKNELHDSVDFKE